LINVDQHDLLYGIRVLVKFRHPVPSPLNFHLDPIINIIGISLGSQKHPQSMLVVWKIPCPMPEVIGSRVLLPQLQVISIHKRSQ
jgi:hypothetical protein